MLYFSQQFLVSKRLELSTAGDCNSREVLPKSSICIPFKTVKISSGIT